ncbi:LEAF RUST 10 DISEASE-RESISTANCE LOCUS RECEPTOR-LIKE PROTEIN KINASE-like 1.2 [Zea mays]|uniref:non-specific serine/threonine protein kinase n=3 Tax=Zea mays TaxID=4577 RepID=A0A1D6FJM6_MAIZE|nr:LEAF RUST 10 DISEASE-RESISTANCE LOCUS RECEPTOR-LIKE PROTEIN KINASE-like 1.2 [Zea mays]AQK91964.1 Putative WAK receptor-like protein kinase family protein [Zea mays]PWZ08811.1 LEAF RUST 10 DISEASE-RESISTANCE LOCUS RECEPTOR-LIKE PROTEIN KINASE-like 1.2 [Zea mays]|eukprot:XP_008656007.1 LEAF RUST 10 DISEASE-RESISTANCE LOCUS RECEPTOR-LIKE PROTEIN KINASE-like 1.2 [Zea mays]
MGVACEGGRATLRLGADNYTVLAIDYSNHTVTVAGAASGDDHCPRVARNVTVPPGTWLSLSDTANEDLVFWFDCVFTAETPPPRADVPPPISCSGFRSPSGATSFVVVARPGVDEWEWPRACKKPVVVPVLKDQLLNPDADYLSRLNGDGYGQLLKLGFQLTWDPSAGPCYFCENSGGQCSYNQVGEFIGCLCSDGRVRSTDCGSKKNKKAIAIGTSIAAGVLSLLLVVMACLYIRKRRQYKVTSSSRLLKPTASGGTPRSRGSTDMESGSVRSLQTHHFTYEELEEATDSFSGTMEIGDGGFGTVYKGHLRDGRVVAVKRLYNNSWRRVEQFLNEAAILSRLRHPNLVPFYGCTSSRSRELLLVYEFVPNGTVADHLHGHRAAERALTWPLRLSVAVEAAAALAYLHAVEPPIVHRDVKTSNILLDASFHVKVADFGLSRLFPLDVTHVSTAPQGTPGYVDPEYHQCYQLTDRSDVYSFGVVLVELISSKPAVDMTRDRSEINLAGMAINKIQQRQLEQLVDLDLGYGSDEATKKAMTVVAELAFRCLQQNGEMRPAIKEVFDALRSIRDDGFGKKGAALIAPRSPDTVHAPWDSISTTPSVSQ